MAIWLAQEQRALPMFEIICLAYFAQYSLPVYLNANEITTVNQIVYLSWDTILQALWLIILGVSGMILCYYLVLYSPLARKITPVRLSPDPYRVRFYIAGVIAANAILALGYLLDIDLLNSVRLAAVLELIVQQMDIVLIILAYQVFTNKQRHPRLLLLLNGLLLIKFLAGLQTGMIEQAFIPVALFFLVRWHSKKKIPWIFLGISITALLFLNQVKHEYRALVWFGVDHYNSIERVVLWSELSYELVSDILAGNEYTREEVVESAIGRMSTLPRLALVLHMTPEVVPYYNGASYEYLIYTWVPRILWPEKPLATAVPDHMDVAYRLKVPSSSASIRIGFIGEAYANFGVAGVLIVIPLSGAFLALFTRLFNVPGHAGSQAIYAVVMVGFLNGIGSSLPTQFGSIIQKSIVYTFILRLFNSDKQHKQTFSSKKTPSSRMDYR
jgi:hypothetical protein